MKLAFSKSLRLSLVLALMLASALLTFGCSTTGSTSQTDEGSITSSVPARPSPDTMAGRQVEKPVAPMAPLAATPGSNPLAVAPSPPLPMPPTNRYRISTFVRDVGEANAAATAFASLPAGRSADGRIVRYAAGVADQQSFLTLDLQNLCKRFNEPIMREMNPRDRKMYDHLAGLKGEAFDAAFVSAMVTQSQRFMDIINRGAAGLPDGEFRRFTERATPPLQQNLSSAQLLDLQIGTAPEDTAPKP